MKVIKFYADWCGPCKAYAPTFEEFSNTRAIETESVDVDGNQELAKVYGVRSIPVTILVDESGKRIDSKLGNLTLEQLDALVNSNI